MKHVSGTAVSASEPTPCDRGFEKSDSCVGILLLEGGGILPLNKSQQQSFSLFTRMYSSTAAAVLS